LLDALLNLALDEVAFEGTEVIDEQFAVEVIGFMGHTAGLEVHDVKTEFGAVEILGANYDALGPFDFEVNARKAEAALLADLLTFAGLNDGVNENYLVPGILFGAAIHDEEAFEDSDLGSRQTDSWSPIHGLEHIIDQSMQVLIEYADFLGPFAEDRIAIFHNVQYHRFIPNSDLFRTPFIISMQSRKRERTGSAGLHTTSVTLHQS
jgi:hypothetical protein